MINKAIKFAAEAHAGATRKGSDIPFILHPLEAAAIVARLSNDQDLMIAAILHDTIEDTDVTYDDIKREFGARIADLVNHESEDKTKTWLERKSHTINTLKNEPRDVKIIAMGDKLSNMRSMAHDYAAFGNKVWERFNVKDKNLQGWYYRGLAACFDELKNTAEYAEYNRLVKQVFG